jgi:hypothetical protein
MGHRTLSGILLQTGLIVKLFVQWHGPPAGGKVMVFSGFNHRLEAGATVYLGFMAL